MTEKEVEAPTDNVEKYVIRLPRPLNIEEKKYLLAVERGDLPNVKRILHAASKGAINGMNIDINCVDSLGRSALTLAIDSEHLEMIELLVVMGVETKDALLRAIDKEFVEAVELLLEFEELVTLNDIEKSSSNTEILHSWQRTDPASSRYSPDLTPLELAAQRNNYEILKLLLDRGATLPMPHDVKCGCEYCIRAAAGDSLKLSTKRISEYKALASPSLIALSSPDPLMTAFQLSAELKELCSVEPESKAEYLKLRKQVEKFAVDLLHQVRSTAELNTILNYDHAKQGVERSKQLARLKLAIEYKQKKFVAHPHVQQYLAAIWYEGVPGFRRMSSLGKIQILVKTAILFPFYCISYLMIPDSKYGQMIKKPLMKFFIHASSYSLFLFILMLVSQRAEVEVIRLLGSEESRRDLDSELARQRGASPSYLEYIVILYVLGFILQELREVYVDGMKAYLRDMWNFIDFTRNSLYIATGVLRLAAYFQQKSEIELDKSAALIPRENWGDFDPQLVAEGLFSAANIFSALKLVHLFSINPHFGLLQISLGRMVIDIVKFFFVYTLVLFAFACGLNQLLWYFAELERKKCYVDFGDPMWDAASDPCLRWRRFSSLFESCQSLFWASFGGVGIDSFELAGIKSYTRFWGLLMFGSYSVINVIVLLNLLIAMMSNSYALIEEHSDTEWKFARTKLWMSYFEEGGTLPPPFNIIPHPKLLLRLCGIYKRNPNTRNSVRKRAREHKYEYVTRALIWRYVVNTHTEHDLQPVTEDDIQELKSDISSWRCELLDIFNRNGMNIGDANIKEKTTLGKNMRMWERRLMKDFQVAAPITDSSKEELNEELLLQQPVEGEDNIARWKRVAKLAVLKSAEHRWGQVVRSVVKSSQIGKSNSKASLQSQQSLKRAMEEAKRLAAKSPLPPVTPINLPQTTAATIMNVIKDIVDVDETLTVPANMPNNRPQSTNCLETSTRDNSVNSTASVGYIDEKSSKGPKPLISLQKSPPKVVKRKHNGYNSNHQKVENNSENLTTLTINNLHVDAKLQNANNIDPVLLCPSYLTTPHTSISSTSRSPKTKNKSPNSLNVNLLMPNADEYIVRPRSRAPSPRKFTNIITASKNEDKQNLVNLRPRSPRIPGAKSPRRGGWL